MKKLLLAICFAVCFTLFSVSSFAESVSLTWNPNSESDLAGYKLYRGTSSRNYDSNTDVGNVVSYQLLLPDDGLTYYLTLTAYDTSGNESGYSNEINYITIDLTSPDAPTLLQILEQISKTLQNIETILREIKSTPS